MMKKIEIYKYFFTSISFTYKHYGFVHVSIFNFIDYCLESSFTRSRNTFRILMYDYFILLIDGVFKILNNYQYFKRIYI